LLDFICPWLREKLFWVPLYLLLGWYFFTKYKANALWLLAFALLTVLLADQVSSTLIKPIFHRLRPCNNPSLALTMRLVVQSCGSGYSFVSSHAANHFGLAAFLIVLFPQKTSMALLLLFWAFAVSFSQVYVGVHFPADVVAGGLLGLTIGFPLGIAAKKIVQTRLTPAN
jgi:undecaprenyl-diphosphatase